MSASQSFAGCTRIQQNSNEFSPTLYIQWNFPMGRNGGNDTNIESFLDFINVLFDGTEGPINIATLRNASGAGPQITSDDTEALKKFVIKHDQRGWGVYACVSTMVDKKHHHSKEAINEIPSLHIDIDSKDIDDSKNDVVRKLKTLRLPPSILVDSGNGIHAYWKFKEAIHIADEHYTPQERLEEIDRIEAALKLLCDLVGGDIKVTQPSAVMRLPGTFNTKREEEGQHHEVTIVWKNDGDGKTDLATYELDDIEEWLSETSPIILRKVRPVQQTAGQDNSFLRYGEEHSYKPPIKVQERLDAMMYMGGLDSSIHLTQVSVSASLLSAGVDPKEVVKILMAATEAAAGKYWERWDKRREERNIKKMCDTWLKKPEIKEKTEKRKKQEKQEQDNGAVPPNSNRPAIKIFSGDHASVADKVEELLIQQDVQFFQRNGELVRPVSVTLPASHGTKTNIVHLREVNSVYARDVMSRSIDFYRYDARIGKWKLTCAPLDVAATIIERKAEWKFRSLVGVIATPTMRPDGSLLLTEGHDPMTDLLLLNPPNMPPIPERPTRADAITSLNRLKDLFAEFPYVDDAARSVALSGVISSVARGAFLNAPMHACGATDAGSGKSYQNDVTAMVAIGDKMPVMSTGANEEETEKRLGSAMIAGQSLISLDNISLPLKGDTLCQLIERPVVLVRVLGQSKKVTVDTRGSLVFATGNQLSLIGDICRRSLMSSLDSKLERPELRQFRGDPLAKVKADRGRYVADCLIIVRAYFVANRPNLAPKLASFEAWSDSVRSALIWLGEADPVDTMEATRADDPERLDLRSMIEAWVAEFEIGDSHRKTVADVVRVANETSNDGSTGFRNEPDNPELHTACVAACEAMGGRRSGIDAKSLGNWLRSKKGRVIDGMRIANNSKEKGSSKNVATLWWVERVVTEGQRKETKF
jgi:putative DNA primase/helicase